MSPAITSRCALQRDAGSAGRAKRHRFRAIDALARRGQASRAQQIEAKLRSVGIANPEIHEIGPSLEDVFVTLTATGEITGSAKQSTRSRIAKLIGLS